MRLCLGLAVGVLLIACGENERRGDAGCLESCGDADTLPRDAQVADARTERDTGRAPDDDAGAPTDDGGSDPTPPEDAGPGTVIAEPADDAAYVFDQGALHTYNFVIAPADLAALDANPAAEAYAQATLEFEGQTFGPLGFRYKGSIGAFLSPCTLATIPGQTPGAKIGKCSIKIDFNHVDPEARFHGLKKLNFHAMGQDPSQLRDRLGYALFREAGIAAPRAVHARVLINGQLEGLYAVVEQIDGRFTKQRFSEGGDGNLYKEVWPTHDDAAPYQAALETNEETPRVDKMIAFKRAIDQGPAAMSAFVDTDYVARYLAVDRVISNDDGAFHWYCQSNFGPALPVWNHNYYWYEAEHAQRMWLIPWDLDSAFLNGGFVAIQPAWNVAGSCTCAGSPAQRPAMCDPLTAQWASFDAQYQAAIDTFLAGPFNSTNVEAKIASWAEQIEAATNEAAGVNGGPLGFQWQLAVGSLRSVITQSRVARGRP